MESRYYKKTDLELLSTIESNSVDLVLTDPPYIISKASGMDTYKKHLNAGGEHTKHPDGSKNHLALNTEFGNWDKNFTIKDLEKSIDEFYRILKPGGSCIIFFDLWKIETLRNLLNKFSKHRIIEWVKTNPVPINQSATYLSNSREMAISCVKGGKATFNGKYDNGIYKFPIYAGKDRFHPTQKSLLLFEELINKHSNKGDIVVDPYVGSGTTALASINTNRKYICGEPSDEYYQKGYDRCKLLDSPL